MRIKEGKKGLQHVRIYKTEGNLGSGFGAPGGLENFSGTATKYRFIAMKVTRYQ